MPGDRAHTQQAPEEGRDCCPWDTDVVLAAASCGHLKILQWALTQGPPAPWSSEACVAAASEGQIHILRWIAVNRPDLPWNRAACLAAAKQNHHTAVVDCLQTLPSSDTWGLRPMDTVDRLFIFGCFMLAATIGERWCINSFRRVVELTQGPVRCV